MLKQTRAASSTYLTVRKQRVPTPGEIRAHEAAFGVFPGLPNVRKVGTIHRQTVEIVLAFLAANIRHDAVVRHFDGLLDHKSLDVKPNLVGNAFDSIAALLANFEGPVGATKADEVDEVTRGPGVLVGESRDGEGRCGDKESVEQSSATETHGWRVAAES